MLKYVFNRKYPYLGITLYTVSARLALILGLNLVVVLIDIALSRIKDTILSVMALHISQY
jgi:hypothetical protein